MAKPLIELKEVTKRFNENIVLYEVSLAIPEGSIFGIIGKSGCGKTTLLNLLVGFLRPSKGVVSYKGKSVSKSFSEVRTNFGFAAQASSFYDKLTTVENLNYFGVMYGMKKDEIENRSKYLIHLLSLEDAEETLGEELSVGMQKRLDIACALIHSPKVLILDEPTANLDPLLRRELLDSVDKINKEGTTVIITSHILGEVDHLCDRIAILNNHKIVTVESPKNLESKHGEKVIRIETKNKKYTKYVEILGKLNDVKKVTPDDGQLVIFSLNPQETVYDLLSLVKKNKDEIIYLSLSRYSLSKVFEEIVKKKNV